MRFRGRSLRTLDPKARLMIPPEFRDIVFARCAEGKFVLTTYDGCLVGFPQPDWKEFEEQLMQIHNAQTSVRNFRRLVIGGAEELLLDNQGRIRLSQAHREYAGLKKDVMLVGQLQKFEIWAPERLRIMMEQNFQDVAQELEARGIDVPL
ncbi:Transcriptional regulator MraZ [Desulfovibrionales bacterium]